jgi:hypothetical protein
MMNANALSPAVSVDTDWSPLNAYPYGNGSNNNNNIHNHSGSSGIQTPNSLNTPLLPPSGLANVSSPGNPLNKHPPGGPLDTPPVSGHSSANSSHIVPDGPLANGRPPNGNPSPPSSLSRSSVGTVGTVMDSRRLAAMEEALEIHHRALTRFLAPSLRDIRGDQRQNKARDKLLRLSAGQFQELSTDVFDELMRREEERKRGGANVPGNPTPKYLLPKPNFHFKRNQARQKLSTLPPDRFEQLATDVFFELERRFPRFGGRSQSRAESIPDRNAPSRTGFPPRGPSRNGNNGPPMDRSVSREGFRGPGPYSGTPPPPSPPSGLPPGVQRGLGSPEKSFGRPVPKQFQTNNVMVPTKGMMIEDDSDGESMRPIVPPKMNGSSAPDEESQAQIAALERKVDELQAELRDKDQELEKERSGPVG